LLTGKGTSGKSSAVADERTATSPALHLVVSLSDFFAKSRGTSDSRMIFEYLGTC
jgi:hypothetical protein